VNSSKVLTGQDAINECGNLRISFENSEGKMLGEKVQTTLKDHHIDIEKRNMIFEFKPEKIYIQSDSVKKLIVIDFETKK
jgi:hypothetical protein